MFKLKNINEIANAEKTEIKKKGWEVEMAVDGERIL
jgi:hypothetical protein